MEGKEKRDRQIRLHSKSQSEEFFLPETRRTFLTCEDRLAGRVQTRPSPTLPWIT